MKKKCTEKERHVRKYLKRIETKPPHYNKHFYFQEKKNGYQMIDCMTIDEDGRFNKLAIE